MITEDYCDFETSKLLKEKGFNIPCDYAYNNKAGYFEIDRSNFDEVYCFRPSLAIVMKWLREVHNISIEPLVDFGSGKEYWWTADIGYIRKDGLVTELCGYNSYEDAAEASIKYCLENLI